MSDTARDTTPGDELERLSEENELLRIRAADADRGREEALRVIARVRLMVTAWERDLPDTIRTEVAASAIREATITVFEERS